MHPDYYMLQCWRNIPCMYATHIKRGHQKINCQENDFKDIKIFAQRLRHLKVQHD